MKGEQQGINTICTHTGELQDKVFKGAISPLYMSTSYAFEDVDQKRYPRYYNTPNQEALCKKIAALELAEDALIFGSGMAAISTAVMAFLQAGDHIILQNLLYGGTYNLIVKQFEKFGITYSFTDSPEPADFKKLLRPETKVIYIETPSNPMLTITDMRAVADIAKKQGIVSMIDNTFASPVNQNPIEFGIDVVIHSATKYMGGHSDICAGAVASSSANIKRIHDLAICLGGSLSDYTVWLLERSLKTMGVRVQRQNDNAMQLAQWLDDNEYIKKVYYPGLSKHPGHDLANKQMRGFGGMISFELEAGLDAVTFRNSLQLIKSSMSLAGVESTVLSPAETSHYLIPVEEREAQGITDNLIRFSVGIEEPEDLIRDMEQALQKVKPKHAEV